MMHPHGSFPSPGCASCESLARKSGFESVTEYLASQQQEPEAALAEEPVA